MKGKRAVLFLASNQRGGALLVVLVLVVILGLAAGIAGNTWRTVTQRAKEEELLWRGDQYRQAIASYYKLKHAAGIGQYPSKLEGLVKDSRSLQTVRHIRQLYKDPMTGDDFVLVRQGGKIEGSVTATPGTGWIIGVRSASELEPLKKDGFRHPYEEFAGAESYAKWEFVYRPEQDQVTTPAPPQPTGSPLQPVPGSPLSPQEEGLPMAPGFSGSDPGEQLPASGK